MELPNDLEKVPDEARIAVSYLLKIREKLGITDEVKLERDLDGVLLKYVLEIYKVWGGLFPEEHAEFIEMTVQELQYEKPLEDLTKGGGYSPTSFPPRLHDLIQVLLPGIKVQNRMFWKPLFNHIPELKRSSHA